MIWRLLPAPQMSSCKYNKSAHYYRIIASTNSAAATQPTAMMSPFSNGKDKDNNQSFFNQKYSIGQCLSFCCCIVLVILTSWAIIYVITLHLDMVAISERLIES
uniref:Uncharacterized protein n=1 Tax=Ditylenchus dipsaci TaxID=166011 RepID=A0A915ED43_9BILA